MNVDGKGAGPREQRRRRRWRWRRGGWMAYWMEHYMGQWAAPVNQSTPVAAVPRQTAVANVTCKPWMTLVLIHPPDSTAFREVRRAAMLRSHFSRILQLKI